MTLSSGVDWEGEGFTANSSVVTTRCNADEQVWIAAFDRPIYKIVYQFYTTTTKKMQYLFQDKIQRLDSVMRCFNMKRTKNG